jgi:HEAT repeat protein
MFCRTLLAVLFVLGSSLPALAQKKKDDSRSSDFGETRSQIPSKIGNKTYAEWKRDLTSPDASVRTEAIRAIILFDKQAEDAVPAILKVLQYDGDASPRVKAAQALRMMYIRDTDRTTVIKGLGRCIGNTSEQTAIRYEAAATLRQFCPLGIKDKDERAAIAGLVAGVNSGSTYELRDLCTECLILAGPDREKGPETQVTDALIVRAQTESTMAVRLKAIMALGSLGRPQDPRKLSQVINVLKLPANWNSSHKAVRIWSHVAIMALEEKVNDKYLQTVADYLKDDERDTRYYAVAALGALEEKAHDYVGAICDMMRREKEVTVLMTACHTLGLVGDKGERVINTLINLTEDDDRKHVPVVLSSCAALAQIGYNSKEVQEALNKVLEHKSLEDFQKKMVRDYIKELQTPKKKEKKEKKDDKRELQGKPAAPNKNRLGR